MQKPHMPVPLMLLVRTREVLEFTGARDDFKIAQLYSNWAVHTSISQSAIGFSLLERLTGHLVDIRDDIQFTASIESELSIAALRAELMTLYQRHEINAWFLHSFSGWHHLMDGILESIAGKPITYVRGSGIGARASAAAYARAEAKVAASGDGDRRLVEQFRVLWVPQKPNESPRWHWILETKFKLTVMGALHGEERREHFADD